MGATDGALIRGESRGIEMRAVTAQTPCLSMNRDGKSPTDCEKLGNSHLFRNKEIRCSFQTDLTDLH